MKYCHYCGQEYENHIEKCADCNDSVLEDEPAETLKAPRFDVSSPPPEIDLRVLLLTALANAKPAAKTEEWVTCGSCASDLPYGTKVCPECEEEIWYGDEISEGEFGEAAAARLDRLEWVRLVQAGEAELMPLFRVLEEGGHEARVKALVWPARDEAEKLHDVYALEVRSESAEEAEQLLESHFEDRLLLEDGRRIEIDDPIVCDVMIEELGRLGVPARRGSASGVGYIELPVQIADEIEDVLEGLREADGYDGEASS